MTVQDQQMANIASHFFDDWANELMKTSPTIDPWQQSQVGSKNEGPYRTGYEALPIKENNEPLVSCPSYGLISKDYYLNKMFDQLPESEFISPLKQKQIWPFAWVRKSVAEKLAIADKQLRSHDLFLFVTSGWRHPAVQKLAATSATPKLGKDEVKRLFATKSPHATGGAVDIELFSLQSFKSLSFSYPGDEYGFYNLEQQVKLSLEQTKIRNIRRILYHVLTPLGFVIHPGEFWHFGYGDPLSAYLTKQPYALFGSIEVPPSTRLTHFQV